MARVDVIMPQMGESIAEGTLSRWMKKVGDEVKRGEPIFGDEIGELCSLARRFEPVRSLVEYPLEGDDA
jgi:hypothetical protein